MLWPSEGLKLRPGQNEVNGFVSELALLPTPPLLGRPVAVLATGELRRTDGHADFIRHLVAVIDTADGIAGWSWCSAPGRPTGDEAS